jgi:hypothetical protein
MANRVEFAQEPKGAVPSAPGVTHDTSPPNGCRIATKVAIWELAENRAAYSKPLHTERGKQLLVPVWELVDFMG